MFIELTVEFRLFVKFLAVVLADGSSVSARSLDDSRKLCQSFPVFPNMTVSYKD